jgi:hypothetical protein
LASARSPDAKGFRDKLTRVNAGEFHVRKPIAALGPRRRGFIIPAVDRLSRDTLS